MRTFSSSTPSIALRSKLFFNRLAGVLSMILMSLTLTSETLGVAPFLTGVEGGRFLSKINKYNNEYLLIEDKN